MLVQIKPTGSLRPIYGITAGAITKPMNLDLTSSQICNVLNQNGHVYELMDDMTVGRRIVSLTNKFDHIDDKGVPHTKEVIEYAGFVKPVLIGESHIGSNNDKVITDLLAEQVKISSEAQKRQTEEIKALEDDIKSGKIDLEKEDLGIPVVPPEELNKAKINFNNGGKKKHNYYNNNRKPIEMNKVNSVIAVAADYGK